MRIEEKNYGYIESVIADDNYILGGLQVPEIILQESGQWDAHLPQYEPQAENFESYGCTVWGSQNCIEILLRKFITEEQNYSERFNYILAGIKPPGADPHAVLEVIRKKGLIDQAFLPMTKTYEEFIQPNPMQKMYLNLGEDWLRNYELRHEWLGSNGEVISADKLKQALKTSPCGVAVYAWAQEGELYVRPQGAPDTHFTVIYGYEDGKFWKCMDSYDHSLKKLDWNFGFKRAKRFYLRKREPGEIEKMGLLVTLLQKVVDLYKQLISKLYGAIKGTN